MDKYAYAHEDEVKLDCLEGLLYKKALKPQSMVQVENWLAQEAVSVQHKEVLLQILCKANYEQAKPYLLQWAEQDLTQVCHIVYVYAREHRGRTVLHRPQHGFLPIRDIETRYRSCLC